MIYFVMTSKAMRFIAVIDDNEWQRYGGTEVMRTPLYFF